MKNMQIIGWVGRDVSVKDNNGLKISTFPVAVNEKVKGEQTTEWIDVTTFGKLADVCEKYLAKGSKVFAAGNFKVDRYTTKDGQDRATLVLTANIIEMLDSKKQSEEVESEEPTEEPTTPSDEPTKGFEDDEIPF